LTKQIRKTQCSTCESCWREWSSVIRLVL